MKRFLALFLVVLMLLSLVGCGEARNTKSYEGMEPEAAAEEAVAGTEDKTQLSDIIRVPFGYLLDWLYSFTKNYGIALIVFSLIVKLVLLPVSIKSKRSMLQMSRLAPEVKALEKKYGDDKQKLQQAQMDLYREEGVSTTGGCLWSLIPLLILFPLYYVIREPLTYMMHNSRSVSAGVVAWMQATGVSFGNNTFYAQLTAASHVGEYLDAIKEVAVLSAAKLKAIDFSFLGVNLAEIPTWRVWNCKGWGEIGLFLIPIISGGAQMISMLISQKQNNSVATDANGEKDEAAAKTANQTTATMLIMMPLMSLWIGYSMPAAISIYWIAQALLSMVQEYFVNSYCAKAYAEEDAARRERAAKRAAAEEEKERIRAERRAANPDGIMDNTSKKKLKAREKEERRQYLDSKMTPEEREAICQELEEQGIDPDRPNSKGRAYVRDRYDSEGNELAEEDNSPVVDDYVEPEQDEEASGVEVEEQE